MPRTDPGLLDPDARAVIDRINALNAPGYETMPPGTARAIAAHLRRNAPYPRVKVGSVRDIDLDTGTRTIKARHYRPLAPHAGSAPTLIFFHGGGWTLGDLDTMDHLCRSLVRQAAIDVVSVDYPLSPESRFPATVDACADAVRAIVRNAEALGLDPDRVALGGDSAGGNLSAVLALMARDGDLPQIRAQCLIYPAVDLRPGGTLGGTAQETMFMRPETMAWFVGTYLGSQGDAGDWRASPLLAPDLTGLPPSYVLTAGHDVLRDQGQEYGARLRDAGVTVVERDFPGQIHNFVAMPYAIPTAHIAIADIAEFLVDHLCGQPGA